MRLQFEFLDKTPIVDFEHEVLHATPLELRVISGSVKSRVDCLELYKKALSYLFQGVSNYVYPNLYRVSVEKKWFGKMEKYGANIRWDCVVDSTSVVVYEVYRDRVVENMYLSDGVVVKKDRDNRIKAIEPIWLTELLYPKSDLVKNHIINAISFVEEYVKGYHLVWGHDGRPGLSIINSRDKVVKLDEIENMEVYVILQLLLLLINKGEHLGVFFIDARGMSDNTVRAIVEIAKLFFGDTFVFMINGRNIVKVEKVVVEVPNFMLTA